MNEGHEMNACVAMKEDLKMKWEDCLPGLNLFQIFALERVHLVHSVEDGRERDGSTVHVGGLYREWEQCNRWKSATPTQSDPLFGAVISDSWFLSWSDFCIMSAENDWHFS